MPEPAVQNYANHRRFLPPWHFFVMPVISALLIIQIVEIVRAPGLATLWSFVVTLAILMGFLSARYMSLRVQNRLVRLEETLRLERLLPGRREDIERLRLRHLIGLRFASDLEVPHLVDRILAGELVSASDVKRAVQHWRPDHLRV